MEKEGGVSCECSESTSETSRFLERILDVLEGPSWGRACDGRRQRVLLQGEREREFLNHTKGEEVVDTEHCPRLETHSCGLFPTGRQSSGIRQLPCAGKSIEPQTTPLPVSRYILFRRHVLFRVSILQPLRGTGALCGLS